MNTRQSGLTLMELMVVMVIVGILAAIAYPSYREQVIRTNRAEAKIALEQRAQALEKCYTRYMAYDAAACAALDDAANTPEGHYNITVAIPTPSSFVVTATPLGGQLNDAQCQTLTLSETGTRGSTPSAATVCW